MRKLAFLFSILLGLGGLWSFAQGQGVNTVPQVGLITSYLKNPTYSAVAIGLVPASSATDIFCISGSTTKTVHITLITVSGTAGTLISVPFTVLLRHSLDTGGTAASTTANPANTLGPLNPSDVAATATLISYTANPTVTDTSPTYARVAYQTLSTTSASIVPPVLSWYFGGQVDFFDKGLDIPKAATVVQQYCVNLNATTVSSGLLDIAIEWTEQ